MVSPTTFWTVATASATAFVILGGVVYHNRRRLNAMSQRLFGSNLDRADRGVLARLDHRLESVDDELGEIRDEFQQQTRLDTERTYQVQHIVEQLDNIDGVNVERRPDGYVIHDDEDFLRAREPDE